MEEPVSTVNANAAEVSTEHDANTKRKIKLVLQ
jgi:hypothetical protein